MKDILGNNLGNGDRVLVLNNFFLEGSYCVRNNWNECYGIIVGENKVFVKRLVSHKLHGFKIVTTDEVILVTQCDSEVEKEFNEYKNEYLKLIQSEISNSIRLKPGTVFMSVKQGDLYVYLGELTISTYVYDAFNKREIKRDSMKGNICIDAKKLINLNGKKITSKDLYTPIYDVSLYYSNMFSNNNSKAIIEKCLYNMDVLCISVANIVGELKLDNILINNSYPYGKYDKKIRLEVLEGI